MTKEKLLEFYNKIKELGMNVSVIRQLRKCSDRELDIVMNSRYPKVMINTIINYEFGLLSIREQEEIIDSINHAKTEEIANGIYRVASSRIILSSRLTTKITKIINESYTRNALYVIELALTNSVLINPNSLEIMKIIGLSEKKFQARISSDIAKSIEVLSREDALEIIEYASKTEDENKSKLINAIAKNREVLSSNMLIKIITLVNKMKLDKNQIELLTTIASDKLLEVNKRSLGYIIKMLSTPNEIINLYNQAQTEIVLLKQRESNLKKDNLYFWNLYRENPEEVIMSIKGIENFKITPYTRIRRRETSDE